MTTALPRTLLDQVMPHLGREWAKLTDAARREAVAMVFAPGYTEDLDPHRPTALLTSRAVARRGLVLACEGQGNMAPVATLDVSYTSSSQLVVVVFADDVIGTVIMRAVAGGGLALN